MHEIGGDDVEVTFEEEFGDDVKFLYDAHANLNICLLYTSPSPRDLSTSRMPSSA